MRKLIAALVVLCFQSAQSQLLVARDTINVQENGYVLKMPWANGFNYSNVSNIDLNADGKKDIVVFDRVNLFGVGRFRCFLNIGTAGQVKYSAKPDLSYSFPDVSYWAILRDYDCDGKEDIFCSTSAGIMVYKNTSTPTLVNFTLVKNLLYTLYPGNTSANLYAASNGLPGIEDIDGDGDLDVLTFSPGGFLVEYHQNLSKETYSICDSLNKFQLNTFCWGNINESGCSISFNQTCTPRPIPGGTVHISADGNHAGSCLMCLDSDGDGDKDLVMGDISCNYVQYAHNTGTTSVAVVGDSTKLYPNFPNKNNTTTIRLNNFPCTYFVDVDGDLKKDLLAAPNANGSENYQSLWYYHNVSATSTVDFQYVKKNLFQDEMIEVGQNSYPILFDYDADGKKDLLIGTFGYYQNASLTSKLTLYRNIGTAAVPAFSLVTRDYSALAANNLNCIMPTTGDIDNDGDVDMIIGTQSGQIYLLTNTAGSLSPCSFSFNPAALFVTPSAAAAPQLFDIDSDGDLDLMIGGKNGRIMYYKNTGTPSSPTYTLISNYFGNVDVKGDPTRYGTDGYAAPFFWNESGNIKLLVGSVTGQNWYFSVPSPTTNCVLITSSANFYNEGGQSVPFFEDINGDGKRDLFLGNGSGGLSFFSSKAPDVSVKESSGDVTEIKVFPNPAGDYLSIQFENGVRNGTVQIYDLLGKIIFTDVIHSDFSTLDIQQLKAGIYILKITSGSEFSVVKKIVVEK